mmetsp:Transcript_110480/g.345578  ORF Transcript_110480/g.345578 Transcript_110480/m.345578 type:complete len:258 (+) Transcript_110480:529-1302(+)
MLPAGSARAREQPAPGAGAAAAVDARGDRGAGAQRLAGPRGGLPRGHQDQRQLRARVEAADLRGPRVLREARGRSAHEPDVLQDRRLHAAPHRGHRLPAPLLALPPALAHGAVRLAARVGRRRRDQGQARAGADGTPAVSSHADDHRGRGGRCDRRQAPGVHGLLGRLPAQGVHAAEEEGIGRPPRAGACTGCASAHVDLDSPGPRSRNRPAPDVAQWRRRMRCSAPFRGQRHERRHRQMPCPFRASQSQTAPRLES